MSMDKRFVEIFNRLEAIEKQLKELNKNLGAADKGEKEPVKKTAPKK